MFFFVLFKSIQLIIGFLCVFCVCFTFVLKAFFKTKTKQKRVCFNPATMLCGPKRWDDTKFSRFHRWLTRLIAWWRTSSDMTGWGRWSRQPTLKSLTLTSHPVAQSPLPSLRCTGSQDLLVWVDRSIEFCFFWLLYLCSYLIIWFKNAKLNSL